MTAACGALRTNARVQSGPRLSQCWGGSSRLLSTCPVPGELDTGCPAPAPPAGLEGRLLVCVAEPGGRTGQRAGPGLALASASLPGRSGPAPPPRGPAPARPRPQAEPAPGAVAGEPAAGAQRGRRPQGGSPRGTSGRGGRSRRGRAGGKNVDWRGLGRCVRGRGAPAALAAGSFPSSLWAPAPVPSPHVESLASGSRVPPLTSARLPPRASARGRGGADAAAP